MAFSAPLRLALFLIGVFAAGLSLLYTPPATFIVKANSELFTAKTRQELSWLLPNAELQEGCKGTKHAPASITLDLKARSWVSVSRRGNGSTTVAVTKVRDPLTLRSGADSEPQPAKMPLCLHLADPVTLYLDAYDLKVGTAAQLRQTVPPHLLQDASVEIWVRPMLSHSPYMGDKVALARGDEVRTPANGPVSVLLTPGKSRLDVTARHEGFRIAVSHSGGEGFSITTVPYLTRLANDPVLGGLWVAVLFLLTQLKMRDG